MRRYRSWGPGSVGLALLVGCAGPPVDSRQITQGGLTGRLEPIPDPPRSGHDSGFVLHLTRNTTAVSKAQVQGNFVFKGLAQQGPVVPMVESTPGAYEAREVSLGMGGRWQVSTMVREPNGVVTNLTFNFTVGR